MKTARIYLKESIAVYGSLSIPVQQLAYFEQLGQDMLNFLFLRTDHRCAGASNFESDCRGVTLFSQNASQSDALVDVLVRQVLTTFVQAF